MHTLEHIGLGRYGDDLDPDGWKQALNSLISLVSPGGVLWLSVPVGLQRVEFNAHRIFNPSSIYNEAISLGIDLEQFFYLGNNGFIQSDNIYHDFDLLSQQRYGLGLFLFRKCF